jgi:hypothetical protein
MHSSYLPMTLVSEHDEIQKGIVLYGKVLRVDYVAPSAPTAGPKKRRVDTRQNSRIASVIFADDTHAVRFYANGRSHDVVNPMSCMTAVRRLETGSYVAVQILENIFKETILPRNKIFASPERPSNCVLPCNASGRTLPLESSLRTLLCGPRGRRSQPSRRLPIFSKASPAPGTLTWLLLAVGVNGRHGNKTAKNGTRYVALIAEHAGTCTENICIFQNVNTLLEIVHPSNVDASGLYSSSIATV